MEDEETCSKNNGYRDRIFELLKEIKLKREQEEKKGILVAFGDLKSILEMGVHPLGKRLGNKKVEEILHKVCMIDSPEAQRELERIGRDGAILIDNFGFVYEPSVYLNIDIEAIDKSKIKPDYGARHIAALATSVLTNAIAFTLSEESGVIREFHEGEVKKQHT